MSDSRAIVLKLSVRDADIVRQQLVSMGAVGETALARLDNAAKAAGRTGAGASGGGGGMGTFRNAVGQAGFQLQDFAVQVQGGTSALTALSQQGSQFLGIFGPAGAIAGAVLTVGILATRLFSAADASKKMQEAQEALAGAMRITNDLFETQADRAERLEREQRATAISGLQTNFTMQAERVREERRALTALEREIAERSAANANVPGFDAGRIFGSRLQERRTALAVEEQAMLDLDRRLEEMRNRPSTRTQERLASEYGPQLPPGGLPRATSGGSSGAATGNPSATLDRLRAQVEGQRARDRERFEDIAGSITPANRALREYEQQQESLTQFVDAGIISEQEFGETVEATTLALGRQLEEIDRRANSASDVSRQLGLTFSSAFEDAIVKGEKFRDVLSGIAQDIAKLIIRKGITEPFVNAVGPSINSATSGIGEWFAENVGNLFTSAPGRAIGGPVSAGMPYMVGERGPELFMPTANGNIVPNHALGGGITFAPSYNIDARGADAGVEQRINLGVAVATQRAKAELLAEINRGGSAARAVGRR